jgi:hypothetical protein
MLFSDYLIVTKLIALHTTLHSVVYYFASSSLNLFNIEECFKSKISNLTKVYVFCIIHKNCLLFELKSVKCRLYSKYVERNDIGHISVTTNTLYNI